METNTRKRKRHSRTNKIIMKNPITILEKLIEIDSIPKDALSNILEAMYEFASIEANEYGEWIINHSEINLTPSELWRDYNIDKIKKENNCSDSIAKALLYASDYKF